MANWRSPRVISGVVAFSLRVRTRLCKSKMVVFTLVYLVWCSGKCASRSLSSAHPKLISVPHVGIRDRKASTIARRRIQKLRSNVLAHSSVATSSLQSGQPIFSRGDEGAGWWGGLTSASPVVLPPNSFDSRWRMWYYGRDSVGLAVSDDGLAWRRVQGPSQGGNSLDPCASIAAFDSLHVGVGDVVQLPNGTLWMYYFDGNAPSPGNHMQVGLAISQDGGVSWQRLESQQPDPHASQAGEFEKLSASWPRVLPPWKTKDVLGLPEGKWYMSYRTYNQSKWSVGAAFSDDGVEWVSVQGPVLTGGGEGSWDSAGVGVRSLIVVEDHLLMFYEAVDDAGGHAIGLAKSPDGIEWQKWDVPRCAKSGGPLLTEGPLQLMYVLLVKGLLR